MHACMYRCTPYSLCSCSIHMKEECSTDAGDGNTLLATGMSSGIVRVWTVVLEAARCVCSVNNDHFLLLLI